MGANKPLVSVIVATRNRAHCLPHALDSIYAQEALHQAFDIEIIVVDDASTDATPGVLRRYPEIKSIRLPEKRGVSAAKNAALRASRGRYITFLDDDDEWLPHKLRIQVAALEANSNAGVVYGQTIVRVNGCEVIFPQPNQAPSGRVFLPLLLMNFCGHHGCLLVRRDAFDNIGDFDESLTSYEDWDVSLRLSFQVAFLFVPGTVDVHDVSPHGLWMSRDLIGAATEDSQRALEKNLRMLPDQPRYVELKRLARARLALETGSRLAVIADAWAKLMATLQEYPEVLGDARPKDLVTHVLDKLTLQGELPASEVHRACSQLKAATRHSNPSDRSWVRHTIARIMAQMALAPGVSNRDKLVAASRAWVCEPLCRSGQKRVLRLMVLNFLGPKIEAALMSLWKGWTKFARQEG